jgi:ADP-heptose:LPS heptosyltransferase
VQELKHQVILTGSSTEQRDIQYLSEKIGEGAYAVAGLLDLESFILLVSKAPLIVSVNSGPIHIAAATGTTVLVLYALTNPQHLPWKVKGKALYYDIPESLRSKNEVIRFVHDHLFYKIKKQLTANDILEEVKEILLNDVPEVFPEVVPLRSYADNNETVSLNTIS